MLRVLAQTTETLVSPYEGATHLGYGELYLYILYVDGNI